MIPRGCEGWRVNEGRQNLISAPGMHGLKYHTEPHYCAQLIYVKNK